MTSASECGTPAKVAAFLALVLVSLVANPLAAQRPVEANTIGSKELPTARIRVDTALVHIGSTTFDLYGVADVELHLFVEAQGARVKRLLWVQFEGYRAGNDHIYDYSDDPIIDDAGHPLYVNGRFYPTAGFAGRRNSDGDHALRLLTSRGYELGSDLARVRLVWLLNEPARDELMFIYLEDLSDLGVDVDALASDEGRWQDLLEELTIRGLDSFDILDETESAGPGGGEDVERS